MGIKNIIDRTNVKKGKETVFVPDEYKTTHYTGKVYGKYFDESKVFNVFNDSMRDLYEDTECIGEIRNDRPSDNEPGLLGFWDNGDLKFINEGKEYKCEYYSLTQNIFSRNTGILESDIMRDKTAVIIGCGSVGSLVCLELARAGVGTFILIDNDIVEYHNICRHQCNVLDVGDYKVNALSKRIKGINPTAKVITEPHTIERTAKSVLDEYCLKDKTIIVGCGDNRESDIYANSLSIYYKIPFISIGFWERAAAGEIFYWLPDKNMPCCKCAIGFGHNMSNRNSVSRRIYTTQSDLNKVSFEPGISADINFVTNIGVKLILDIINTGNKKHTPRLLEYLKQYTFVCNTNNPEIGGEKVEIFSYPLQITTSLVVDYKGTCPPCEFEK